MPNSALLRLLKDNIKKKHFEESLLFVSIGVCSAVVCSFYAKLFGVAEHFSTSFFGTHSWTLFIFSPLCLILSFLLVKWFAPGSNGSGIPQVLACIEDPEEKLSKLFLRKSVIVIKILSSFIAIVGGAAIGREGPSIQIAAAISSALEKWGKRLNIKVRHDQILVAGAASGLAAAFNTPIGGVVYAIEELSKEHLRNFRDVLLLSVVVSGITAQMIIGSYLYLGSPTVNLIVTVKTFSLIALAGLISGFLGACFSRALFVLIKWRSQKSTGFQLMVLTLVGLILATTFYFAGERSLYSGKESINFVLYSAGDIPWYEVVSRSLMPLLSSMTGVAGGIFAPSLSAGAVIGGALSQLFDPEMRTILGLVSMVGFLTGVTHTPITSFMLVLEMTDRRSVVFALMAGAFFSSFGAHLISEESFYEETLHAIKKKHASSVQET